MAGVNRALQSEIKKFLLLETANDRNQRRKCIFLSHKSEDKASAKKIGEYIMKELDLDIYLDEYDTGLQKAIEDKNDKEIVNHINKGIDEASHLLCIISDKTQVSWWVSYEIGYAKKSSKDIASLQLKSIDDIPSFLKVEKYLSNIDDINRHYGKLQSVYESKGVTASYSHPLSSVVSIY